MYFWFLKSSRHTPIVYRDVAAKNDVAENLRRGCNMQEVSIILRIGIVLPGMTRFISSRRRSLRRRTLQDLIVRSSVNNSDLQNSYLAFCRLSLGLS